MQLLMLSALVFFLFLALLKRTDTISLDTDWFYRKGARQFYIIIDKSLNGINNFCNTIFAGKMTGAVGRFFKNGPARLAGWGVIPLRTLFGDDQDNLTVLKSRIDRAFNTGSFPVGISAISATLFIVMLFIFY